MLYEDITQKILGAAFEVINELGAGFLESVYHKAMLVALHQKGLKVEPEFPLAVMFRGQNVGQFYADLLVEDKIIVELKAVQTIAPEHKAQVINYLKATGMDVALLINFGHPKLEYRRLDNKDKIGQG
jgi:GxxExxY protein